MAGYSELTLWLHQKTPEGGRTYFQDDAFFSVLPAQADGLAACSDLSGREAIFLLIGSDPTLERPVLFTAVGEVSSLAKTLIPTEKNAFFSRLYLLGIPGAKRFLPAVTHSLKKSGAYILMNEKLRTKEGEFPPLWSVLARLAGENISGLGECAPKKEPAHSVRYGLRFFCRGRGADARAVWEKGGIRIEKGSRSSPMDATPSLIQPLREKIKTLVDEGSLVKEDGIWTFVRDVKMTSAVQAASILMRTSATAAHWVTEEGDTLADLFARR